LCKKEDEGSSKRMIKHCLAALEPSQKWIHPAAAAFSFLL
jgi:hypothetical protein